MVFMVTPLLKRSNAMMRISWLLFEGAPDERAWPHLRAPPAANYVRVGA